MAGIRSDSCVQVGCRCGFLESPWVRALYRLVYLNRYRWLLCYCLVDSIKRCRDRAGKGVPGYMVKQDRVHVFQF